MRNYKETIAQNLGLSESDSIVAAVNSAIIASGGNHCHVEAFCNIARAYQEIEASVKHYRRGLFSRQDLDRNVRDSLVEHGLEVRNEQRFLARIVGDFHYATFITALS